MSKFLFDWQLLVEALKYSLKLNEILQIRLWYLLNWDFLFEINCLVFIDRFVSNLLDICELSIEVVLVI